MPSPIDRLIDRCDLRCTLCGARAWTCDCVEKCSCGWIALKGQPCRNPGTARCSTKVKYGRYDRKAKRYV